MAEEEPMAKRFKNSCPMDYLFCHKFQDLFAQHWMSYNSVKTNELEIIATPFRVCKISNFIKSESFIETLKHDLAQIKYKARVTDMFSFQQTDTLKTADSEAIQHLVHLFKTQVRDWMKENTGIDLNMKLSMSSTYYTDTNYLLCHDDKVHDRRIAFILYLSENWTKEDGGALDLFDTDEFGLPHKVRRSIFPEYNSLVFFEVTDNSFHQVAEITSSEKKRWTINGWFHGRRRLVQRTPRPELNVIWYRPFPSDELIGNWVLPSYLTAKVMQGIRNSFEINSYSFLSEFLQEHIYSMIHSEVTSDHIVWRRVGPADIRNYEVAVEETLFGILREFYKLLKSIEMFRLLQEYTELDLVPTRSMMPKMTIELQRWSKGCYTLICDKDRHPNKEEECKEEINVILNTQTNLKSDDEAKKIETITEELEPRSRSDSESSNNTSDNDTNELSKPRPQSEECEHSKNQDDDTRSPPLNPDSENSRVSDIGDYLSHSSDRSEAMDFFEPGTLDVIMQFNTEKVSDDETIDYVDPMEEDGTLIQVPQKDNHLCLVYKTDPIRRLQRYVNHHFEGYFYSIVCSYQE